jgi:hypothetical protein
MKYLKSLPAIILCMLKADCLQTRNGYLLVSVKIAGNTTLEQTTLSIFYKEKKDKTKELGYEIFIKDVNNKNIFGENVLIDSDKESEFKLPCIFIKSLSLKNDSIEISLYNGVNLVIAKPDGQCDNFIKLERYLLKRHFTAKLKYIKCQTYNLHTNKYTNLVTEIDIAQVDQKIKEFSTQLAEYETRERTMRYLKQVYPEYFDWNPENIDSLANDKRFYNDNHCDLFEDYHSSLFKLEKLKFQKLLTNLKRQRTPHIIKDLPLLGYADEDRIRKGAKKYLFPENISVDDVESSDLDQDFQKLLNDIENNTKRRNNL